MAKNIDFIPYPHINMANSSNVFKKRKSYNY